MDDAAEKGDAIAREILHDAARELAAICDAVRGQLFEKSEPARVAYIGGVFRSRTVLEKFTELVGTSVAPPIHGPAAGALLEAYRAVGVQCVLSNVPAEKE